MPPPASSPTPSARPRPTLGIAVITLDAAAHLADCLGALSFADRIVLVDSGSRDATLAIAALHGAQIHHRPDWAGFGVQKNRAVDLLDTDWVLVVDADEVVSPALAASIRDVVAADADGVHALDRLSAFCGQWVRHSGWRPDAVPRLFKRGTARFSEDRVHERLVFSGTAALLDGVLLHYSYDDIGAVLRKLDSYSGAGARQRFERGDRASFGKAVRRGLWAFVRTYFLRLGCLDGRAGFMIAVFNAETVYYRFLRLAELGRAEPAPGMPGPDRPPQNGRD
ncbi:glycosyltransferase family 2 protein [Robbsia sp. Bb-Pol-6]|uniref:Glycosyltransferase family 2 protein n=1 Tax=Robbsia betulipollinis TaxID=2981849 RepID=A0ABT3ZMC9_9BURK|nr:glycosyltransferase family 2 protein [Robbsia betulipollinis]